LQPAAGRAYLLRAVLKGKMQQHGRRVPHLRADPFFTQNIEAQQPLVIGDMARIDGDGEVGVISFSIKNRVL
jgi:hypothetical protein